MRSQSESFATNLELAIASLKPLEACNIKLYNGVNKDRYVPCARSAFVPFANTEYTASSDVTGRANSYTSPKLSCT